MWQGSTFFFFFFTLARFLVNKAESLRGSRYVRRHTLTINSTWTYPQFMYKWYFRASVVKKVSICNIAAAVLRLIHMGKKNNQGAKIPVESLKLLPLISLRETHSSKYERCTVRKKNITFWAGTIGKQGKMFSVMTGDDAKVSGSSFWFLH